MKTKLHSVAGLIIALACLSALNSQVATAFAQGTAFTYQGRLNDGTNPVTGNFDMRFQIYNVATGGSVIAGPITNAPVAVTNGLFTVMLDFGAGVFTGSPNWLHIGVRTNGSAGGYTSLLPRQQLTPTPYAIFAETANAAGLTGTVPVGDLSGVALLAGGNAFTGNQSITGLFQTGNGSGSGPHTDMIIGPGGYYSGEEHSIDFDDSGAAIGSLILGYNGNGYFSVGNLYNGFYRTGTKAFTVFGTGNVNVDPTGMNSGLLNNGNTNSSGLTFGVGSGEGIASKRTAGGNRYGLDFYTSFKNRMSIDNNGVVGIGRSGSIVGDDWFDIRAPITNSWGGMYMETAGLGQPFYGYAMNGGIYAWTWLNGSSGGDNSWNVYDQGGTLTLTPSGRLGVNCSPSQALEVNGEFLLVDGNGGEKAYMGGDGSGGDVQFGSLNSSIDNVAFYNAAKSTYMHIYCSSITINGGADLAEPFKITSGKEVIPEGAVVVIDEQNPGHLKMSDQGYDTHVAGVISGANGINPGIQMQQQGVLEGGKNVALTGRVYVQADTSNGAIKPGDLLTTSITPGHAMKVTDHAKAAGAILGKAMTGLSEGKGMVLVLVTLQ